jgi:hypothetical protein
VELRRVIWSWETALLRLLEREPALGRAVRRSCRPIAAERRDDGRLTLALGCWWPPDLETLGQPVHRSHLEAVLSEFLDDQVRPSLAAWPGGMAPPSPGPDPDEVAPPDVLAGLVDQGMGRLEGERLVLTERGWLLANEVLLDLAR